MNPIDMLVADGTFIVVDFDPETLEQAYYIFMGLLIAGTVAAVWLTIHAVCTIAEWCGWAPRL